jgi:hypothetical protein
MVEVDGELVIGGEGQTVPRPERAPTVAGSVWTTTDDALDHSHPPPFAGGFVSSLTSTDLGLVAVGFERFRAGEDESDQPIAAVRTAEGDRERWRPIPLEDLRGIEEVAPWRGGWLGVGLQIVDDGSRTLRSAARGRVIQGRSDEVVADVRPVSGIDIAPETDQWLPDICTGGSGAVVRGWSSGGGDDGPLVASSVDGRIWARATADDDFAAGDDDLFVGPCAVSDGNGALLAGTRTGDDHRTELLLWHSPDSARWTALHRRGPALADRLRQPSLTEVVAVDDGFVVVGTDDRGGRRVDLAAWHVDGDGTVRRLRLPDEVTDGDVHAAWEACLWGDDLAVLGSETSDPVLWRIDLADLLAATS